MTLCILCVPWVGIEPTLPKELDFESSASTNSATKAKFLKLLKYWFFKQINLKFSKAKNYS